MDEVPAKILGMLKEEGAGNVDEYIDKACFDNKIFKKDVWALLLNLQHYIISQFIMLRFAVNWRKKGQAIKVG